MFTIQNPGTQIRSARQVLEIRQSYSDDLSNPVDALRRLIISAFEAEGESDFGKRLADRFVPAGMRMSESSAKAVAKIETAFESGKSFGLVIEELLQGDLGL